MTRNNSFWIQTSQMFVYTPIRRQAIIETNAGPLSIGTLWTNFCEILIKILNFSVTKKRL